MYFSLSRPRKIAHYVRLLATVLTAIILIKRFVPRLIVDFNYQVHLNHVHYLTVWCPRVNELALIKQS
jgi:hypothetical protein